MRPAHVLRVLLLFALVAAVGCESENRGKVEGKRWRSGAATVKGQPVPDGAMMIDFRQNGKLVFRAGSTSELSCRRNTLSACANAWRPSPPSCLSRRGLEGASPADQTGAAGGAPSTPRICPHRSS